jgi:hypothetical protein
LIVRGAPNRPVALGPISGLEDQDFRDRYAHAREARMDFYAEQIRVVAFDESGDILIDQYGDRLRTVANHAKFQRDRLKVDRLKWTASRLFPQALRRQMELLGQSEELKQITIKWLDSDKPAPKPEPPRQLTYNPAPPPAGLSPEAWASIVRISDVIQQIAPGEQIPEHALDVTRLRFANTIWASKADAVSANISGQIPANGIKYAA